MNPFAFIRSITLNFRRPACLLPANRPTGASASGKRKSPRPVPLSPASVLTNPSQPLTSSLLAPSPLVLPLLSAAFSSRTKKKKATGEPKNSSTPRSRSYTFVGHPAGLAWLQLVVPGAVLPYQR